MQPPEVAFPPICVRFLRWAQKVEMVNVAQEFLYNILLTVNFLNVCRVETIFDSFSIPEKATEIENYIAGKIIGNITSAAMTVHSLSTSS